MDDRWLAAFFSHAMPHWRHRRATVFITALFALRIPTANAAAAWAGRPSAFTLQARGTSDVVKDKYFIPAIASMGAVLLLSFVCCYWLGWCFNRDRMQRFYSRTAYPASTGSHLAPQSVDPRPIVNLSPNGTRDGELKDENFSNVERTGVPHSQYSSAHGSPHSTSTAQLQPVNTQYAASNWHYNYNNQHAYPPVSQGFQPFSTPNLTPGHHHTPMPTNAEYTNPSSGMHQNRGYHPEAQHPGMPQLQTQTQTHFATPTRMSSMSSADSSTQIGEQPPYGYFPHQGNTLSYASSRALSMTGDASGTNGAPERPAETYGGVPEPSQQLQRALSNPPAYIDDGKKHPNDKKSRKKN